MNLKEIENRSRIVALKRLITENPDISIDEVLGFINEHYCPSEQLVLNQEPVINHKELSTETETDTAQEDTDTDTAQGGSDLDSDGSSVSSDSDSSALESPQSVHWLYLFLLCVFIFISVYTQIFLCCETVRSTIMIKREYTLNLSPCSKLYY
jgi:hypothetical protein